MKLRTGFVSNSSSSSFIAYGACTTRKGALKFIDDLAPGKVFEIAAPKLNEYYKKDANFEPFTIDDERFRECLLESLGDGWPVEFYDIFSEVELGLPVEDLYEDDEVVIGFMVDTEDQWGVERVFGQTFSNDEIALADEVCAKLNIKPNLLMGRRAC